MKQKKAQDAYQLVITNNLSQVNYVVPKIKSAIPRMFFRIKHWRKLSLKTFQMEHWSIHHANIFVHSAVKLTW